MLHFKYSRTLLIRTTRNCQHLSCLPDTVDAGYKNTGYKNISDIRTLFSTPDSVTGIYCIPINRFHLYYKSIEGSG